MGVVRAEWNEILRLEARIKRLEEALKLFAEMADAYDLIEDDDDEKAWDKRPTIRDLRRARAALEGK